MQERRPESNLAYGLHWPSDGERFRIMIGDLSESFFHKDAQGQPFLIAPADAPRYSESWGTGTLLVEPSGDWTFRVLSEGDYFGWTVGFFNPDD